MATRTRKAREPKDGDEDKGIVIHAVSHGVEFDCREVNCHFVYDGKEYASLHLVAEHIKSEM